MKTNTFKTLIILLVILNLVMFTTADPGKEQGRGKGQIKKELRAYFNNLAEQKLYTGAVLIARDGKVIFKRGYGLANYETGQPNLPTTVYPIASMTKAFTAMSIMMLKERGLLSLDDTIADYIPEFYMGDQVTIHQLLRMTGGLYPMLDNPIIWERISEFHTPYELLEYFMYEPLVFEPGTQWAYCNSCYVTLGVIIETISGMSYRDFIKTNILDPLKMRRTSYDPYLVDFPRKAIGYDDLISDPPVVSILLHPSVPFSAGGICSTVIDMFKWDQALYSERLVSAETLEDMFTPGYGDYGYGWYIDNLEVDGQLHKHIWHWGSYIGYHSYISRLVDDNVTIILLLNITAPDPGNQDQLRPIAKDVASIIFQND